MKSQWEIMRSSKRHLSAFFVMWGLVAEKLKILGHAVQVLPSVSYAQETGIPKANVLEHRSEDRRNCRLETIGTGLQRTLW